MPHTTPPTPTNGHDPDLYGGRNVACAEEERQRRRTTHPRSECTQRQSDPLRMLGLAMLKQMKRDLEAGLYKDDKARSGRPGAAVDGSLALEDVCRLAGVSVRRVRQRFAALIDAAKGPLEERTYAEPEALREDESTWVAITWMHAEYGIGNDTSRAWCADGSVTAVKTSGRGGHFWHVRGDEDLQERVQGYWDTASQRSGGAPRIEAESGVIRTHSY